MAVGEPAGTIFQGVELFYTTELRSFTFRHGIAQALGMIHNMLKNLHLK